MSDTTPRSGLPLLAAAQAQKHVTHNEALIMLDALSCARILDRDLSAPPASPADGDTYLVAASATGDWTGQDGNLAYAIDGDWRFYPPYQGLIAYIADEDALFAFDGASWVNLAALLSFQNIAMVGINTTADATNKLAVKSSALLFDNSGGGVQAKLNKASVGDTASLLYQDNYSGRAEFGLCGDDNFHCKVSPDGSSWTDAIVIDRTTGALTLGGTAQLPGGSASSPSLALNGNSGLFYDAANNGIGFAVAGAQAGYFASGLMRFSLPGGGTNQLRLQAESTANNQVETYNASPTTAPTFTLRRGRGTIAAPAIVQIDDTVGYVSWQPYTGAAGSGFTNAARIQGVMTETATVDGTHAGMQLRFLMCPNGSGTLSEVMRLDPQTGLAMFGSNTVIDRNRAVRLRSTTIAGAVSPATAGNLFYHSDAQNGHGELAVDDGSAYRHAGQASVKKLTVDADATYLPRIDGRIVRDSAVLSADRKLVLSTSNATDGYKVEVSRRGSSGAFNRAVYQADGTTLIATLEDNASADFVFDAAESLWFQK
jgi:hypothetical protein